MSTALRMSTMQLAARQPLASISSRLTPHLVGNLVRIPPADWARFFFRVRHTPLDPLPPVVTPNEVAGNDKNRSAYENRQAGFGAADQGDQRGHPVAIRIAQAKEQPHD